MFSLKSLVTSCCMSQSGKKEWHGLQQHVIVKKHGAMSYIQSMFRLRAPAALLCHMSVSASWCCLGTIHQTCIRKPCANLTFVELGAIAKCQSLLYFESLPPCLPYRYLDPSSIGVMEIFLAQVTGSSLVGIKLLKKITTRHMHLEQISVLACRIASLCMGS